MSTPDDPRPANEWVIPSTETPDPHETPRRSRGLAVGAASLVVAFAVGAGVVYGFQHVAGNADASSTLPSAGAAQQGPRGFFGGGSQSRGGVSGEQYVQGTITATTASSVTVRSSSGTATYAVTSQSEILRNGQQAALSSVKAGDAVFLHVYPDSSGRMLVERLFAGTSAGDDGFGPPSGQSDDGTPGAAT